MLLSGCASKDPLPDEEIEKWKIMAEQAQGIPLRLVRKRWIASRDVLVDAETIDLQQEKKDKPLPSFKVTLRMHDADLVAVLQALSVRPSRASWSAPRCRAW